MGGGGEAVGVTGAGVGDDGVLVVTTGVVGRFAVLEEGSTIVAVVSG